LYILFSLFVLELFSDKCIVLGYIKQYLD